MSKFIPEDGTPEDIQYMYDQFTNKCPDCGATEGKHHFSCRGFTPVTQAPSPQIFVINGAGGTGKDTFVNLVKTNVYNRKVFMGKPGVYNISSVDVVKEAAQILGWNGVKNEANRLFLHELKMLSTKFNNGPFQYMLDRVVQIIKEDPTAIIFFHIREPNEIMEFRKIFNCKTIFIKRDLENGQKYGNDADDNVGKYAYDIVIKNKGSIEDFEYFAKVFCENYIF